MLKRIEDSRFFCIALCMSLLMSPAAAQMTGVPDLPNDGKKTILLPVFTEHEQDVGSTYLTKKWCRGTIEMTNHRRIPEAGQLLLFNFDKVHNVLFVINEQGKQWSYPIDSIAGFEFMENGDSYSFAKIPWISTSFFLMPMYQSEKGYSLYRRLFTKCIRAEYVNAGYYSEGKKYDEFVDYYEYYLTYPGNTSYRKVTLRENVVRRALRDEAGLLQEFFNLHDNEINEQNLLGIIQYIDDKKYPD
jgi:hypothetical protein